MKSKDVLEKNVNAPGGGYLIFSTKTIVQTVLAFSEIVLHRSDIQQESYFLDKIFDGVIRLFLM